MDSKQVAIVVVLIAIALFTKLFGRGPRQQGGHPYRLKAYLLSKAERSFYGVLCQAAGSDRVVFSKVRVADVLAPEKGMAKKNWRSAFNRIVSKHFDFVLCDPKSLAVTAVVELHDKSHKNQSRVSRDRFLREACASAGLRLFEFEARAGYSVHQVREVLTSDGPEIFVA